MHIIFLQDSSDGSPECQYNSIQHLPQVSTRMFVILKLIRNNKISQKVFVIYCTRTDLFINVQYKFLYNERSRKPKLSEWMS